MKALDAIASKAFVLVDSDNLLITASAHIIISQSHRSAQSSAETKTAMY